jgi:hypothetical protein
MGRGSVWGAFHDFARVILVDERRTDDASSAAGRSRLGSNAGRVVGSAMAFGSPPGPTSSSVAVRTIDRNARRRRLGPEEPEALLTPEQRAKAESLIEAMEAAHAPGRDVRVGSARARPHLTGAAAYRGLQSRRERLRPCGCSLLGDGDLAGSTSLLGQALVQHLTSTKPSSTPSARSSASAACRSGSCWRCVSRSRPTQTCASANGRASRGSDRLTLGDFGDRACGSTEHGPSGYVTR